MKTTLRFWAAIAVTAGLFAGCSDLEDYKNKVDELDGRVTALETITTNLNKNVEALQTLYSGATINSATKDANNVWTIVLSNGETLTLNQGSVGVANAPVMSVDKDGYWMVDYDGNGGNAPEYIKNGEDKVLASGTDGVTPVFGVDAEKYWTVSYDGGTTFTRVLDPDGQPVSALPAGEIQDPYFADVKVEGEQFKVTLRTGEELVIPVVSGFLCSIESVGVQQFNAAESKPYNVTLKGVKSTMITAPQGWTATLSEPTNEKAILTVTAPALTKAVIADSKADVCILAFSTQGLATIAKMQVSLSDAPVVINPIASVTPGEATESTLAYSVAVSDVTSWKYIHQKSSEAAPDAAKIAADGVAGSQTSLVFEALDPSTEYTLYVLPINGEQLGSVASGKNTTATPAPSVITDLYQAYVDGKEIEIAGVKYSQAVNGEATLLSATEGEVDIKASLNQKTAAVIFLEAIGTNKFTFASVADIKGNIAITSRYIDKPVTLACTSYMKTQNGSLAIENLCIDFKDTAGGYFLNNSGGTEDFGGIYFKNVVFKNITKPIVYASVGTKGFVNFVSEGCTYHITNGVQEKLQLINFYKSTVLHTYKKIVFDNNIVYCDYIDTTPRQIQLINYDQAQVQDDSKTWELEASICNNTVYNLPSNNGYFKFYQVASLKYNKNIFVAPNDCSVASYCMILYSANQSGTGIDTSDNIAYGLANGTKWTIAHSNSTFKPATNEITKLSENPLSTADDKTGTFTPTAAYASYGAQR